MGFVMGLVVASLQPFRAGGFLAVPGLPNIVAKVRFDSAAGSRRPTADGFATSLARSGWRAICGLSLRPARESSAGLREETGLASQAFINSKISWDEEEDDGIRE
jgi:hypothetical protein